MSYLHFQLTAVVPLDHQRLRLTFGDGASFEVDLTEWIRTSDALATLADAELFARASLSEGGHEVCWVSEELGLSGDNLRNLAVEQAGEIGHERIWNWMHETGLTLEQAAQTLGISRRMLSYYRSGEKPIPRHIWLACLGWEAVRPKGKTLPKHLPTASEYAELHA